MYSILNHKEETLNKYRRRVVTVTFSNGTNEVTQEFQFSIDVTLAAIKKTVLAYLDELNYVPTAVTDFTPEAEVEAVPTAAELAKTAWEADRAKLKTLMELVRDGVFTGTEKQITDLKAKVKADFNPVYLN